MRARFILSEMAIGLRRNLTMTVAAVITVAIAMFGLASGWLIHKQASHTRDYWAGKIEVSVFLTNDVTETERESILSQLTAMPNVEHVYYESKQQAYQRFKQEWSDAPELVSLVSPNTLPESFRIKLHNPHLYQAVVTAMQGQPGVEKVVGEASVFKEIFTLFDVIRNSALIITALAVISALLLVYNTARVAAFTRRREIAIMRLVGASNTYVRLPFLLESAAIGLVGGLLALAATVVVKGLLVDRYLATSSFTQLFRFLSWSDVLVPASLVLLAALALTSVASVVTVRRHLRV